MAGALPSYRPYTRELPHSYVCGVFPCLEAIAAGRRLEAVILPEREEPNTGMARILAAAADRGTPVIRGDRLRRRLSGKDNCLAVGVVTKPDERIDGDRDHLVLVEPADRGNLGSIMRSAAGFGLRDLALIGRAADHEHPGVLRASMGARFRLRVERFATAASYLAAHRRPVAAFLSDGPRPLAELDWPEPCALVFGNEGAGLESAWRERGAAARIEHGPEIDSLNLAVAVGIALHARYLARRGDRT